MRERERERQRQRQTDRQTDRQTETKTETETEREYLLAGDYDTMKKKDHSIYRFIDLPALPQKKESTL